MPDQQRESVVKPLGGKAYGSIPHLPGSRRGPADKGANEGQCSICCERRRDKYDRIIVQEKLDGSCVSVARIDGVIHPLVRAGWPAVSSPYEQHHLFDAWARENAERFLSVLQDGERIVGEWLAQAHGTRYDLTDREPFVAFDIMRGSERTVYDVFWPRAILGGFSIPHVLGIGSFMPIETAMERLGSFGGHNARDPVEGAVWRVERKGKVDFLAKYVRAEKVDGCYLPELTGCDPVWNWRPKP